MISWFLAAEIRDRPVLVIHAPNRQPPIRRCTCRPFPPRRMRWFLWRAYSCTATNCLLLGCVSLPGRPLHRNRGTDGSLNGSSPDPEHPSMRRYVGGQRLCFSAARPWERATFVVDNSDVTSPKLIRRSERCAAG